MRKSVLISAVAWLLTAGTAHADQTWSGKIADSACGAKHESGGEMGEAMNDRDCTLACVRGGSKFVFVADGKVYTIANQDFAGVRAHAGEAVKLTGVVKDDSIVVTKIDR